MATIGDFHPAQNGASRPALTGSVLQFKCFSEIKGTETWK